MKYFIKAIPKGFSSTKCINHWANSVNFKGVTFNMNCSGLTGQCFEMPNASHTNRYVHCKKTIHTIERQKNLYCINAGKKR